LLTWIARSGNTYICDYLLSQGASIDSRDRQQQKTALMWAVESGHYGTAKLLLKKEANPFLKTNTGGKTALNYAVDLRNHELIHLLLDHQKPNPQANVWSSYHAVLWSAFKQACQIDDPNLIETLLGYRPKNMSVNAENGACEEAFLIACQKGHLKILEFFLKNRFKYRLNINIKNSSGDTGLVLAASRSNLGAVQLLLKYGAAVNPKNTSSSIFRFFGQRGDEKNQKNKKGLRPLFAALSQQTIGVSSIPVVLLLLENGANPNARNEDDNSWAQDGDTSLMQACRYADAGDIKIIHHLLNFGANPHLQDKKGNTALQIYEEKGLYCQDIAKALRNAMSKKSVFQHIWGFFAFIQKTISQIWAECIKFCSFEAYGRSASARSLTEKIASSELNNNKLSLDPSDKAAVGRVDSLSNEGASPSAHSTSRSSIFAYRF